MLTSKSASISPGHNPNILDEAVIERYIRYPETLTTETHHEIAALLEKNTHARAVASFYETYYEELDGLADYTPPELERFINTLFAPPTVVPLFPYHPKSADLRSIHASLNGQAAAFDTVALLASHIHHVLVCVIRSRTSPHQYRLQVLAEESRNRAHALVSFPEMEQNVITDAQGIASFQLHMTEEEAPLFTTATLHFPLDEIYLSTDQLHQMHAVGLASTPLPVHDLLDIYLDNNTLVLRLGAKDALSSDGIKYIACESEGNATHIFPVEKDATTVSLSPISQDQAYWIRLYA